MAKVDFPDIRTGSSKDGENSPNFKGNGEVTRANATGEDTARQGAKPTSHMDGMKYDGSNPDGKWNIQNKKK